MKKIEFNRYLVYLCLLIPVAVSFYVSKKSFFLSEGWWETYAWLGQSGDIYKDFNLAVGPLYYFLIKLLSFFTNNLYNLRIFFVILYALNIYIMYCLARKFASKEASAIGVLLAQTLLIINTESWLSKDYHTLVTMYTLIYCLLIIKLKDYKYIFFISCYCSLGFLLKQNIAIFCFISTLLIIIIKFKNINKTLFFVITVSVIIIGFLKISPNLLSIYIGNDAKGDFFTLVTRFIVGDSFRVVKYCLIFILLASVAHHIKNNYLCEIKNISHNLVLNYSKTIKLILSIFLLILIFLLNQKNLFIPFSISFFLITIFLDINKLFNNKIACIEYHDIFYLSIFLILLVYANTLTGGYNYVSTEILNILCFSILLNYFFKNELFNRFIIITGIFIFCIYLLINNKYFSYSFKWWGYTSEKFSSKNFEMLKNNKLHGIYADNNHHEIIINTEKIINAEIKDNKNLNLFAYPNIPMFYWLYNIQPKVKNIVQWFDVIKSSHLTELINTLKDNNPDLVFWLKSPKWVYESNKTFKNTLSLDSIDDIFIKGIRNGNYKIIYRKVLLSGNCNFSKKEFYRDCNINNPVEIKIFTRTNDSNLIINGFNDGSIISYSSYIEDQGAIVMKLVFQNQFFMADFIEKNLNYTPLDINYPVFLALKKNDNN